MKQNIRLFRTSNSLWSKFLDSNPQFYREIRGKSKPKNIITAAALSVIVQFLLVIYCLGQLPDISNEQLQRGRYGVATYDNSIYYIKNELGHWIVNWQLWWLDLFIILSFIAIFTLLVAGTYMLVSDMVKETEKGTLNFIRLTPQSASSVLLGKILGVPILLYTAVALLLPLHLMAGLQSHIPVGLILIFYLTIAACCFLIYSLALFWSLLNIGIVGFKPWLASGLVAVFFWYSTVFLFHGHSDLDHFLALILIFNPGMMIGYLVDAAQFDYGKVFSFLSVDDLATLSFYGQTFWAKASVGISLMLINFGSWTYLCWSVLKRYFRNPDNTILSKTHSYWLTTWFIIVSLGFTLQKSFPYYRHNTNVFADNFIFLQVCLSLFSLCLIFALSPHRQNLHDWARYYYQANKQSSLWRELVLGENSPGIIAVALNLAIAIALITPSIFLILPQTEHHFFWGLVLSATNILLCCVIVQSTLTSKTRKRGAWSIVTLASITVLPLVFLGVFEVTIREMPVAWLFSFVPTMAAEYASASAIAFALCGQWLAILIVSLQFARKLKQAGASETKILMNRSNALKGGG